MKKKVRLNSDRVKKIVNEKLKQDGTSVHESKIDLAIKKYLIERQNNDTEGETEDTASFTSEANTSFIEMIDGLYEMLEDLELIKTKEPDVLMDMYPEEVYSEEYINNVIKALEKIIEGIEYLVDISEYKA